MCSQAGKEASGSREGERREGREGREGTEAPEAVMEAVAATEGLNWRQQQCQRLLQRLL